MPISLTRLTWLLQDDAGKLVGFLRHLHFMAAPFEGDWGLHG